MLEYLSINKIFITVFDYQMSYIEFVGTVFYLWSVWLTTKEKVLCWPTGIIGEFFYILLFYQIQLYSDFVEQFYYLILCIYGWWAWLHPATEKQKNNNDQLRVSTNDTRGNIITASVIIGGTLLVGTFMKYIHLIFPSLFSVPASFPYLDALTTIISFVAMFLITRKKLESWYLWIVVDIIGVYLYFSKGVKLIGLEYALFLGIAIRGFLLWKKELKNQ